MKPTKYQVLRAIGGGVIAGLALFVMPFFMVQLFLFMLLVWLFFRITFGSKKRQHMHHYRTMWHSMTPEQQEEMKANWCNPGSQWHNVNVNDTPKP